MTTRRNATMTDPARQGALHRNATMQHRRATSCHTIVRSTGINPPRGIMTKIRNATTTSASSRHIVLRRNVMTTRRNATMTDPTRQGVLHRNATIQHRRATTSSQMIVRSSGARHCRVLSRSALGIFGSATRISVVSCIALPRSALMRYGKGATARTVTNATAPGYASTGHSRRRAERKAGDMLSCPLGKSGPSRAAVVC